MGSFNRLYCKWRLLSLTVFVPLLLAPTVMAATLLPFKADYSLELVSALPETNIIDADGLMHSELIDHCDFWISSEEFFINLRNTEGDSQIFVAKSNSRESKNGDSLQFKNSRILGSVENEAEVIQGHASITKKESTAFFNLPEVTRVRLDPKAIFPATLTRTILDAALRGERFLKLTLFDGSMMEKGVLVSVVIGRLQKSKIKLKEPRLSKKAWPMSVGFFAMSNQTEIADYQVDLEMNENGIPLGIKMNFGEYGVKAELARFESLPSNPKNCVK
ncbi:MAG: DUF1849 family protein [Candidatus Pacebacteria bacterium]|nr:DUF1849 family protein [Candidatus Paceibacterota bacterium]